MIVQELERDNNIYIYFFSLYRIEERQSESLGERNVSYHGVGLELCMEMPACKRNQFAIRYDRSNNKTQVLPVHVLKNFTSRNFLLLLIIIFFILLLFIHFLKIDQRTRAFVCSSLILFFFFK